MSEFYLACYKGKKQGKDLKTLLFKSLDWLVRKATGGEYAHCEIVVKRIDGQFDCYSSSLRDDGVRCKTMSLPSEKWDLIPIQQDYLSLIYRLNTHFGATKGQKYDYWGAIGVVWQIGRQRPKRWFCSEWCAEVLGLENPAQYSPNSLAHRFQLINSFTRK